MNPLHLIWIIPISMSVGFVLCAVMSANDDGPREPDESEGDK